MRDCGANSKTCLRGRVGRTRLGAAALALLLSIAAPRLGLAQNFTLANSVFPSTPVGQSTTQSVTLTVNAALALQSITIPTGFKDYSLGEITGCTIDGITVNAAGTVCTLNVTYTPIAPGSTASPMLARTAPLFVTDIESGNPVTYNFGLTGAATGPTLALSAGTFTRYAGEADEAATDPGDNGLGVVSPGYAGDGGPANEAQFAFNVDTQNEEGSSPMAVDSAGNLYIADGGNFVIRRVDAASGNIALYAGEPGVGATDNYDGGGLQAVDGVPATSSPLALPYSLMLDAAGNLYFLEQYSTYYGGGTGALLREVNAATGIISTIAGSNIWYYPYPPPYAGPGTCADPNHCGDGGPATAAFLAAPIEMTMDSAGNIYLYFPYGNIREINASTGIIDTLATPSTGSQNNAGYGMTMGADGNLYVANYDPNPTSVSTNAAEYLTQVNPSTGATAIVGGSNPPTVAGCQQTGTPFNGWTLDFYVGGLTSDGGGNLYDFFNDGCNAVLYDQQYETWMNLNSGLGYELYLYQGGYGDYGPSTIYNVVDGLYFFNYITTTGAAPDNLGNFYMMSSYNQVAKLSTSAAALPDYGSQGDGTTSAAQTVVVWNMGNGPLTATVTMPVDYVLLPQGDASACAIPFELAAGQSCNLDISFSPTSNGELDEIATITEENGQKAQVQFFGAGAGTPVPRGSFSPQSYNFGSQPVNVTTNPQPITFSNGGGATLDITGISITGTNASNFAETNNCPATLAAGASCTINVTFTPGAATSFAATLSVTDNATDSPETAALSGTGVVSLTGNISINETIQLSDAPALAESTMLAIGEQIQVSDQGAGTTLIPSTLLAIGESLHLIDSPASAESTLLPINETIHVADAESMVPIGKADSSISLTASPSVTQAGNLVSLTAVVQSPTAGITPTGSVSFFLGSTLLGTAPLAGGSAGILTSQLPVGVNSLTAVYSGDADFNGSTSTPVTITVVKANSTITLTATPTTVSAGDSVTFTAVVRSATGATATPTGSVSFLLGSTPLNTASLIGNSTTFTTTQLPTVVDSITAVYSGDVDFSGSTSAAVSEEVSSFTLLLETGSGTVFPGGAAVVTLTASPSGGAFANPITLSVSGLPSGATANFDPSTITPGSTAQKSTLTIQTANQTAANGSSQSFGLRTGIAFGLLLPLLGLRRIRRAGKRGLHLTLFALVAFAAATAIAGCTGGGFFVQPPQTYSITVTATSGPVTQSSVFKLTVE